MIDEIMAEARTAMQKSVIALQNEMATVRTGRANAHLLDQIRIEYYGSQVPINQVATVGVPEPRLIAIQPWDKSAIPLIRKGDSGIEFGIDAGQRWHDYSIAHSAVDRRPQARVGAGGEAIC